MAFLLKLVLARQVTVYPELVALRRLASVQQNTAAVTGHYQQQPSPTLALPVEVAQRVIAVMAA